MSSKCIHLQPKGSNYHNDKSSTYHWALNSSESKKVLWGFYHLEIHQGTCLSLTIEQIKESAKETAYCRHNTSIFSTFLHQLSHTAYTSINAYGCFFNAISHTLKIYKGILKFPNTWVMYSKTRHSQWSTSSPRFITSCCERCCGRLHS